MMYSADIQKLPRHFLKKEFTITDWAALEPYFKVLDERVPASVAELEQWLKDAS